MMKNLQIFKGFLPSFLQNQPVPYQGCFCQYVCEILILTKLVHTRSVYASELYAEGKSVKLGVKPETSLTIVSFIAGIKKSHFSGQKRQ